MKLNLFLTRKVTNRFTTYLIILIGSVTTLAITPSLTFDPINVPKMTVLVIGASLLSSILLTNWRLFFDLPIFLRIILLTFTLGILSNLVFADSRFGLKLYGEWGRSTGALTYLAFTIVFVFSSFQGNQARLQIVRNFLRLSYVVSGYTIIQYMELDPVNWNSREPFATLGNINFMSAFLGLATVLMLSFVFSNKSSLGERIHFFVWVVINLFIIILSGSIQGLAMILAGLSSLVIFWSLRKGKFLLSGIMSIGISTIGTILFLGTVGRGPLGESLMQPSVQFRLDYWRAGLEIFQNFPVLGTGLDSYGDFYREYRDAIAVERTGPQRVTNTAHNVFLDLLSGGGIIVGGSFLLLFAYVVFQLIRLKSLTDSLRFEQRLYLSAVASIAVFYSISIHQIGVGVWGFIILGLSVGFFTEASKSIKSQVTAASTKKEFVSEQSINRKDGGNYKGPKTSNPVKVVEQIRFNLVISILAIASATWLVKPPLSSNIMMLSALKENKIDLLLASTKGLAGTTYSEDRYLDLLIDSNEEQRAVNFAREVVNRNPRQYFAWTVLALDSRASQNERELAAQRLQELDPMNKSLRIDLEEAWRGMSKEGR